MKKYSVIGVNRLYEVKCFEIVQATNKENVLKKIENSFDLSLYYTINEIDTFKD